MSLQCNKDLIEVLLCHCNVILGYYYVTAMSYWGTIMSLQCHTGVLLCHCNVIII